MQATIHAKSTATLQECFALSASDCPSLVGCVVTMPTPSLAFTFEVCQIVVKCKTTLISPVGQIMVVLL